MDVNVYKTLTDECLLPMSRLKAGIRRPGVTLSFDLSGWERPNAA